MLRIKQFLGGLASLAVLAFAAPAAATDTPAVNPGFACPAGYQWSVNTPIPSCVPSVGGTAAAIPCNGGQVTWSGAPGVTCGASVSAALDGVAKTVSSSNGSSGNATFTCTNGAWVKTGSSSCTAAPCAAGTKSWTVGGQTCSGTIATTAAGSTSAVASTGANSGSANFTCSAAGTWGAVNPGATCAAANCGALYVAWFSADNANKCLGYTQSTPPGGTSTAIDDIYPTMGSANFQCAAGGVWGVMPGAVCAKSDGQCPAMASATWTNPNFSEFTCTSGPLPTGSAGQQVTLTDSIAPLMGSAAYSCVGGVWTPSQSRTCSSAPAPSANCPATTLGWSVGGNYCNAATGSAANGAIAVLSDTLAPTTGSAYASCNNGSWSAPYSATCAAAAAAGCQPGPFSWSQGGNTCSGFANAASAGQTVTLTDNTAPATGSALVSCTPSGWGSPYSPSCSTSAPAGCPAGTFSWTSNGSDFCSGYANAAAPGQSATLTDSTAPTTGSANVVCNAGNWGSPVGTCTVAPAAPSGCAAVKSQYVGAQLNLGSGGMYLTMPSAQSGYSAVLRVVNEELWATTPGPKLVGVGEMMGGGCRGTCYGSAVASCSAGGWSLKPIAGDAPYCKPADCNGNGA